jgi:hypothetical protein
MRSPAFTSWSTPLIVALPLPDVNVRIWSTVCFYRGERMDQSRTSSDAVRAPISKRKLEEEIHTSSPISPSTGTVIRTNWLYSPVHSTRRNSPDSLGSEVVMSGKYAISCFGGSIEGVVNFILGREVENGLGIGPKVRVFAMAIEELESR